MWRKARIRLIPVAVLVGVFWGGGASVICNNANGDSGNICLLPHAAWLLCMHAALLWSEFGLNVSCGGCRKEVLGFGPFILLSRKTPRP